MIFLIGAQIRVVQATDYPVNIGTTITIKTVNNPHSFRVNLDDTNYNHSFFISVTSPINGPVPGCRAEPTRFTYPSILNTYTLPQAWVTGTPDNFQIEYFKDFRFIAKKTAFQFYAAGGSGTYLINPSPAITRTGNVFMAIDRVNNFLYLLDEARVFSYDLNAFNTAMTLPLPVTPPTFNNDATVASPTSYSIPGLKTVKIQNGKLFLMASTYVKVFNLKATGALEFTSPAPQTYDNTFLDPGQTFDFQDIGFKGDYAFILDSMLGVYVVYAPTPLAMPSLHFTRKYGKFLEVSKTSLIIVTDNTNIIYEYFLIGDPTLTSITFNQNILTTYGNHNILKTDSDEKYLYLATDEYPLIIKHSIPAVYKFVDRQAQELGIYRFSAISIKATLPGSDGSSIALGLDSTGAFQEFKVAATKPYLECTADGVAGCEFDLLIQATTRYCSTRVGFDPTELCFINQDMKIAVLNSGIPCWTGNPAPIALVSTSGPLIEIKPNTEVNKNKPITSKVEEAQKTPVSKPKPTRGKGSFTSEKSTNSDSPQNNAKSSMKSDHRHSPVNFATSTPIGKTDLLKAGSKDFTIIDGQKTHEEIIREMGSENNSFMVGLMFGAMVLVIVFGSLSVWWFCIEQESERKGNNKNLEEEKSNAIMDVNDSEMNTHQDKEQENTTENIITLGDESQINFKNEVCVPA